MDIEYTINNSSDAIDKIITFISSNGLKTIKQKTQLSGGSYIYVFRDFYDTIDIIVLSGEIDNTYDGIRITACDSYTDGKKWYEQNRLPTVNNEKYSFFIKCVSGSTLSCLFNDGNIIISTIEQDIHLTTCNIVLGYISSSYLNNMFFMSGIAIKVGCNNSEIDNRRMNMSTAINLVVDNDLSINTKSDGWCMGIVSNNIVPIDYWTEYKQYYEDDLFLYNGIVYRVLVNHISSNIISDLETRNISVLDRDDNIVGTCVMSLNLKKSIPTYYSIMSKSPQDIGNTYSTLNKSSLIMPIQFFCLRDPEILGTYSYIGRSDYFNYVNMYNISSNSEYENNTKIKYKCMSVYRRRYNDIHGRWYAGIAFKIKEE